jgi:hypothetical protein
MKYIIENSYDEVIGKAQSIQDARKQVEQHVQNGLAESYEQTCKTLKYSSFAIVSDITFGNNFYINKAA